MNRLLKAIKHPGLAINYLVDIPEYRCMSDEKYLKWKYKRKLGEKLDLMSPQTFCEKLQWLKIYDRRPEYTMMVDKYKVRQYISEVIGNEYLIPILGHWNNFNEIDFNALPNQFVLKCNHDSGGLIICRDKKNLDIDWARKKINKCLKKNYFWSGREWPYKNVKPCIIAEKFMIDDVSQNLIDYKFYCFNGEPKFLYISEGLEDHSTAKISFVNLDWTFAPFKRSDYRSFSKLPKKPVNFSKMIEFAKFLSRDIPFLRVDFYEINNRLFFGELTFFPTSGFQTFEPDTWNLTLGSWINFPK